MPNKVDEVKLRMDLVLLMSLGVAAPLEPARFPFEGLRDGLALVSGESEERSNGRRGIGRRRGGLSCDMVLVRVLCGLGICWSSRSDAEA